MRAVRATRVSSDALAKVKEREERAKREKAEEERREAERKEKEKGLGEALFGVAKGAFGAQAGANPFSTGGGAGAAAAANPFAKPAAASANPFSAPPPASSTPPTQQQQPAESTPTPTTATTTADTLPQTFAAALSLNNPQPPSGPPPPPIPWPTDVELPTPYPVSFLDEADYETLDPQPPAVPQATSMELDDDTSMGGGSGGGGKGKKTDKEDKDVFESDLDSTFQKFADRLAQNPEQCIRYEFGGVPLLYSKTDAVGKTLHDAVVVGNVLPRCGGCGGRRVFEVQMTPRAIVELEEEDGESGVMEGMDWGTVVVAVCEGDCVPGGTVEGEGGYSEEWVGVQWEELGGR